MSLLVERKAYKPFQYPWAFEYWKKQQQAHWLPEEVPLADDVRDFKQKLTPAERNLVTHIFRFFTQSDIEIMDCYHEKYAKFFKPIEVKMMLVAFQNMETVHIAAYSHLLETLGMPDETYSQFLSYKEMKNKFDWLHGFDPDGTPLEIAKSLIAFSGATEGVSLFASFAMLLNFTRFNKMKGMGQIISWSVRDESLHCEGIARLFQTFIAEHPWLDRRELELAAYEIIDEAVRNEDAFIDLAFEMGPVEGLTSTEMKQYIRSIADIRLQQLGFKKMYNIKETPLPWLVGVLNGVEYGNFFETRPTDYSKAASTGSWNDAYDF